MVVENGVEVGVLGKSQTTGLDKLRKENPNLGYFVEEESE